MTTTRSYVLRDGTTADALIRLADRETWTLIGDHPRDHDTPRARTWELPRREGTVRLQENFVHCVRSVDIDGDMPTVTRVVAVLDCYGEREVFALAGSDDPRECLRGLYALTHLPADTVDDARYLAAYRHALSHDHIAVRGAALRCASSYAAWPGMRELVAAHAAVEEDLVNLTADLLAYLEEQTVS